MQYCTLKVLLFGLREFVITGRWSTRNLIKLIAGISRGDSGESLQTASKEVVALGIGALQSS